MITKERAEYIVKKLLPMGGIRFSFRGPYGATETETIYPDGLTMGETMAVRMVWKEMPGNTSFFDALNRVAKGKVVPHLDD